MLTTLYKVLLMRIHWKWSIKPIQKCQHCQLCVITGKLDRTVDLFVPGQIRIVKRTFSCKNKTNDSLKRKRGLFLENIFDFIIEIGNGKCDNVTGGA